MLTTYKTWNAFLCERCRLNTFKVRWNRRKVGLFRDVLFWGGGQSGPETPFSVRDTFWCSLDAPFHSIPTKIALNSPFLQCLLIGFSALNKRSQIQPKIYSLVFIDSSWDWGSLTAYLIAINLFQPITKTEWLSLRLTTKGGRGWAIRPFIFTEQCIEYLYRSQGKLG